jgi:hypothetical protein
MDLAFGATEASVAPPVGVVSDRSNGICCGVLGCFKNASQTLKKKKNSILKLPTKE